MTAELMTLRDDNLRLMTAELMTLRDEFVEIKKASEEAFLCTQSGNRTHMPEDTRF